MLHDEREIAELTREGTQYLSAGMLDRVELVNEQLVIRGADPIAIPKQDRPAPQTRTSTQAATRKKRTAD